MTMNTTSTRPLADSIRVMADVIEEGTRVGLDLFEGLARNPATIMVNQLLKSTSSQISRSGKCSCHIPPPCWMPRNLGDVVTPVCPGATATLRIRVTNCTTSPRDIQISPAGKPEDVRLIEVKPPSMPVGPMERGVFIVTATIPANANFGQEFEVLIWVRGCLEHYLRWTIKVAKRGADCCFEIDVDDCQDYLHHWYDHFYCERPCLR